MRKVLLLVCVWSVVAAAATTGYHVVKEIAVGGDGGWDYPMVDSGARRLYLSHNTHVVVVESTPARSSATSLTRQGSTASPSPLG